MASSDQSAAGSSIAARIVSPSGTAIPRWAAFNAVGLAGMLVQLGIVALLVEVLHVHFAIATAVGVEAAILNNFVWHQRWTWRDRPVRRHRDRFARLARFHLLNGSVSLVGNLGLTTFFAGVMGLDVVASNVIAIAACSLVNFVASDSLVFARPTPGSRQTRSNLTLPLAAIALIASASPAAAGPSAPTIAAWQTYQAQIDARYGESASAAPDRFFALDRDGHAPKWRTAVLGGEQTMIKVDPPSVPDGKIHHWIGAIFVPGVTIEALVDRLEQNAGRESQSYADVLASRLLERNGDRLRVFMKLRRTNLITVHYNTEHDVEYRRLAADRATARSVATKIAELADVGTPREREKSADEDNGFLWRLNAYWRYLAVPGGVIVECESVSLSRPVPLLLRPVANSMVDRIARDSLSRTLATLKSVLTAKAVSSSQFPVSSFKLETHWQLATGDCHCTFISNSFGQSLPVTNKRSPAAS
jgi:putative flippase GtrA